MATNLTFQSNAKQHTNEELTKYALFMGGLNVTRDALVQYDPLRTGFGRIFMIRTPHFVEVGIKDKMAKFRHILEFGNIGVSGNNNIQMQMSELKGGYTNRQMEIPNIATDDANELVIKTYEFSGSPVREVIQYWMNGVSDFQTGYSHYNGLLDGTNFTEIKQSEHTAEFIYVVTDPSGTKVEYAALFANCFPKECKFDHFNYESGNHELVPLDISFTCTRYMSPQINALAVKLLAKYRVLMNSLNFHSGITPETIDSRTSTQYDHNNGKLVTGTTYDGLYNKSYVTTTNMRSLINNDAQGNTDATHILKD